MTEPATEANSQEAQAPPEAPSEPQAPAEDTPKPQAPAEAPSEPQAHAEPQASTESPSKPPKPTPAPDSTPAAPTPKPAPKEPIPAATPEPPTAPAAPAAPKPATEPPKQAVASPKSETKKADEKPSAGAQHAEQQATKDQGGEAMDVDAGGRSARKRKQPDYNKLVLGGGVKGDEATPSKTPAAKKPERKALPSGTPGSVATPTATPGGAPGKPFRDLTADIELAKERSKLAQQVKDKLANTGVDIAKLISESHPKALDAIMTTLTGKMLEYRKEGRADPTCNAGIIMAEGRIKCRHCKQDLNLKDFEDHSGGKTPDPAVFTYIKSLDMSLADLMMLVSADQIDNNLWYCMICSDGGDLLCCDGCPASYHAHCLGIKPPKGDDPWFCHACRMARGEVIEDKPSKTKTPGSTKPKASRKAMVALGLGGGAKTPNAGGSAVKVGASGSEAKPSSEVAIKTIKLTGGKKQEISDNAERAIALATTMINTVVTMNDLKDVKRYVSTNGGELLKMIGKLV